MSGECKGGRCGYRSDIIDEVRKIAQDYERKGKTTVEMGHGGE